MLCLNDCAIGTNDHRFDFTRLDQRCILTGVRWCFSRLIWLREIIRTRIIILRTQINRLFTSRDQSFLLWIVRQCASNAIIDRLVLIGDSRSTRIFRLHFDRLIIRTNDNWLPRTASTKEVVADAANKHCNACNTCEDQTTTTTNRTIPVSLCSATEIVFGLHGCSCAEFAALNRLSALCCPMIVEIIAATTGICHISLWCRRLRCWICASISGRSCSGCRTKTESSTSRHACIWHVGRSAFTENIFKSLVGFALRIRFCGCLINTDSVEHFRKFGFQISQTSICFFFAITDFRQIQ